MSRMRFGIFLAPFHPPNEHASRALERDFQLVEWLDELGFDEAWIGEHHSAGFEIIACPEVFIAAAAERTRHIRLGTGVVSLPYHHPLMVADRIMQLDHQTRGRVMFGVGPGALPSDAYMMGIDTDRQREMMDEALGVLVPLLRGEVVDHESDWFTLKDARLQLRSFREEGIEMAVASQVSPAGARAAGKHGLGLLSIGATSKGGFDMLSPNWQILEERSREFGHEASRATWRLVGPMHIAETREQARENVRFGLGEWLRYFNEVAALPLAAAGDLEEAIDSLSESGFAVIGTPDDAIAQIESLEKQSGGFGCFLQLAHNWADWVQTKRSYELFARYVAPRFQGTNDARIDSMEWAMEHRPAFMGSYASAVGKEIQKHQSEQAAKKGEGEAA